MCIKEIHKKKEKGTNNKTNNNRTINMLQLKGHSVRQQQQSKQARLIKASAIFLLYSIILEITSNLMVTTSALKPATMQISKSMSIIDKIAETLHYENIPPNKNGDYKYEYRTTNGITAKVAGNSYGVSGVLQYISNDGVPITLTYTADEDGYHPVGEHIPKMPDYILRSLEYIKKHRKINDI